MRKSILIMLTLLVTAAAQAQTSPTYDEIRTKIHLIAEAYKGHNLYNEQALVIVLQRLCDYYQGRMTQQQYKVIADDVNKMKAKAPDEGLMRKMENALQVLRDKTDTLDVEQRILDYYKRVPQEHIYVHTDRSYYVPGDTVWFRAHLVDAVTHTPISRSRYVYVELHDQQSDTLMQRIIVKCDSDGVFANAIQLPKSIRGGCYTLAAYTQWMRNFPIERFFYKQLWVVGSSNLTDSKSAHFGLGVRPAQTQSPLPSDSLLVLGQRKGQLLIQLNKPTDKPLVCVLYGSGNLIVTDYTQEKVLRIDSRSLRPGNLSIAMVNRETGDIIAESQTNIEGDEPQVTINVLAGSVSALHIPNIPIDLSINLAEADGTPLHGSFSLSVTDYDVVKPDTVQPSIDKYLEQQPADYSLADMLRGRFPIIDFGFQTSQTISGFIRGTIFKKVKHPKLMLVRPDTGLRQTFELGDSCRFTINGLDFPDGTTYVLEGMRQSGSTHYLQLQVTPMIFPRLHAMPSAGKGFLLPEKFARQAQEQVMYGSADKFVELPEVVKEKKRRHHPENRMKLEPFKALYDDEPLLNNASTMETLLATLGMRVGRDEDNNPIIVALASGKKKPIVFIDDIESSTEELLSFEPSNLQSIEYFKHNDPRLLIYRWDAPDSGVLLIRLKAGAAGRKGRPLSMATIRQQGYKPDVEFYSPQYPVDSEHRPDHRTTLYWNPKVKTDEKGHASVRFYASDISKHYLVTLEGASDDGTIVHRQQIIE